MATLSRKEVKNKSCRSIVKLVLVYVVWKFKPRKLPRLYFHKQTLTSGHASKPIWNPKLHCYCREMLSSPPIICPRLQTPRGGAACPNHMHGPSELPLPYSRIGKSKRWKRKSGSLIPCARCHRLLLEVCSEVRGPSAQIPASSLNFKS